MTFDRSRLKLRPLACRESLMSIQDIIPLTRGREIHPTIELLANRIRYTRRAGAPVVVFFGAHVIRAGVQLYLIDLMKKGYIQHLATHGAGAIHDFELAIWGATTEDVQKYLSEGQFGLWIGTSYLNNVIAKNYEKGAGKAIGDFLLLEGCQHNHLSLFASAVRLGIPITVHKSIGQDIIDPHPNFDPAAWGCASYSDFLTLISTLEALRYGVVLSFGSAVMAPEVFLKAVNAARHVADIDPFTTAVFDLRADTDHWFRPIKNIVQRPTKNGDGFYINLEHKESIPQLWECLTT